MSRLALLLTQMDDVYERLSTRLRGLSDAEYFWQPTGDCWTVHQDRSGRWVTDYEAPDPEPPPFTTMGWRLVHLGDCKLVYHDWAFGPRTLTFPDLEAPSHAAEALARFDEGQALLREDLETLGDEGMDRPVLTNWGDTWPAWRIFWTMIDHDAHHGGEIGCLRDFLAASDRLRRDDGPPGR